MPQYGALMNNLIVTTDRFIMNSDTTPSSGSSSQGAKPRIAPTPLAWSVALRASRDITIQALPSSTVVCLSRHSSHLSVFRSQELDGAVEYIDLTDEPILMNLFSLRILA